MDDKRVVKALATIITMIQEKLPNIETIITAWLDEGSSYGVEKIIPLIEQLREVGYDISISDDLRAKIVFKVLERKGA